MYLTTNLTIRKYVCNRRVANLRQTIDFHWQTPPYLPHLRTCGRGKATDLNRQWTSLSLIWGGGGLLPRVAKQEGGRPHQKFAKSSLTYVIHTETFQNRTTIPPNDIGLTVLTIACYPERGIFNWLFVQWTAKLHCRIHLLLRTILK